MRRWCSASTRTRGSRSERGEWYFTWAAVSAFYRRYLRDPVVMRLEVDGELAEGITTIAQNSDPYSYFRARPLHVCEGARRSTTGHWRWRC